MRQRLLKIVLAFALLLNGAQAAFAASAKGDDVRDMDDPYIELSQRASGADRNGGDNGALWIAALLGGILLIGLTQILSGRSLGGPSARNLFLGVRLQLPENGQEQSAWVRALDSHSALVVSAKLLSKGDRVRVNLASLPGYPENGSNWVDAEVKRVRSLGGNPVTYEARLRFPRMTRGLHELLTQYVRRLGEHGALQHA